VATAHEQQPANLIDQLVTARPSLFASGTFQIPHPFLPLGWYAIADSLCNDLEILLGVHVARFRPIQSKEKFGSWRFYWSLVAESEEVLDRDSPFDMDIAGMRAWPVPNGAEISQTPTGVRVTLLPSGNLRQAVHARVRQAEVASERVCMWCGQPGQFWTNGWIHVACDQHRRIDAMSLAEWRRRVDERQQALARRHGETPENGSEGK